MPTRIDIDINLFAPPGGTAPDAVKLQQEVEQGLGKIWPSFGLPAKPVVSIKLAKETSELFDFSLSLDGHWVPVPVCQQEKPAAPLYFRILTAIFENRCQLVTEAQLRALRAQQLASGKGLTSWGSAPLNVWRALASLLLKNGFSLDRLEECFEKWQAEEPAEQAFERLIESLDALGLTLVVNSSLAARQTESDPGWEKRFPELYTALYQDLGIFLPQANVEISETIAFEDFGLRLNDLWVPVLPGLSQGSEELLAQKEGADVYLPSAKAYFVARKTATDRSLAPVLNGAWAYIFDWVNYWVRNCASWYVNTGIVDAQMDSLEEDNRSLIVMIREQWSTFQLCAVLRNLLQEGVGIRNLSEILDVLLRIEGPLVVDDTQFLLFFPPVSRVVVTPPGVGARKELSAVQLAGQVRASLKYPVSYPYMENGVLPCYNVAPDILRNIREGFFQDATPQTDAGFHTLLHQLYHVTKSDYPRPVFLVPTGIRPAVVAAFRPYFPELVVLGHEELPPFFIPQIKGTINIR